MADIHELTDFIAVADRTRFWEHEGLEAWCLPYIFLALFDFPPGSGAAGAIRPEWLRFTFDARVRTIEDLWIRTSGDFRFTRLAYEAPKRGSNPRVLLRQEPVKVDGLFLRTEAPTPHPYAVTAMARQFPGLAV